MYSATISEKFHYTPGMLSEEDIYDALQELEAWREVSECETPDQFVEWIVSYTDFFSRCVGALNKRWPGASPRDERLVDVILTAIAIGDER